MLVIGTLLSSCVRYQYVALTSEQPLNASNEFVTENDTLLIKYNFAGDNCPVTIHVYNKSAKPIYVDWKKSALIIEGRKYDYWQEVSHFDGSGSTTTQGSTPYAYTDIKGSAIKDERITFIPPRSYIESRRMNLQRDFFEKMPQSERKKANVPVNGGTISATKYEFTPEDTPLEFRSLVTISSTESFSQETYYESNFWVSEIVESDNSNLYNLAWVVQPQAKSSKYPPAAGNRFRLKGGASNDTAAQVLGTFLLIPVLIVLAKIASM